MRLNDKSRVPVAGITDQSENRGLPRGARNQGGMTERDKLKLWNMQTALVPFWSMLAARIWREG
jgi:hypothetical protein